MLEFPACPCALLIYWYPRCFSSPGGLLLLLGISYFICTGHLYKEAMVTFAILGKRRFCVTHCIIGHVWNGDLDFGPLTFIYLIQLSPVLIGSSVLQHQVN
jgi:hypothetical protein